MLDQGPEQRREADLGAEPLLAIEDLSVTFRTRRGPVPAVVDFSLAIQPGEAVGLVGESGCGKSTVALAIMRDLGRSGRIDGGAVRFKGRDLATLSERALRSVRGREIAMVYQEPMASLNPAMTIGRQLAEVPVIHEAASWREGRARARRMLDAVKLPDLDRILDAYPHQLSGGQQQRVVIAMALLAKPALLLLDEPTTALDVTVQAGVLDLIREIRADFGAAMLFISHNLGLVLETCDSMTVMYAGQAVESGAISDVFERMRHPYTQGLLRSIPLPGADKVARPLIPIPGQPPQPQERPEGCAFAPRCAYVAPGLCDRQAPALRPASDAPGHRARCLRFDEIDWEARPPRTRSADAAEIGEVVLRVEGLRKHYAAAASGGRSVKANEDVSFELRAAETLAIVGESGCGKSTLAKVLLGLETATAGAVTLDGREVGGLSVQARDPASIAAVQMVFQNPFDTLNPSQTVGAQILRTLEKFRIGDTVDARREEMLRLLDLVKLPRNFAERYPRQLSGGQKQRIGVARAFAAGPRVVVADEPVSALDVSVQAAVTELLMDIQRERGTAILFISHDLAVVRYIADRVAVMYLGHLVESGATAQVFRPPYHPYTEALLSAAPVAETRVRKRRVILEGDAPSALAPPPGCVFQTRCPHKSAAPEGGAVCEREEPPLRALGDGHLVKCHLAEAILRRMDPVIAFGPG